MNRIAPNLCIVLCMAAACAPKAPPEPVIIHKEVPTIVREKCMDQRKPEPELPVNHLSSIADDDVFALAQAYLATVILLMSRVREDDTQIKDCVGGG